MLDEPLLDIDDIQGHILVGFRGRHQRILGLRFDRSAIGRARAAALPWIDRVVSTRSALEYRGRALAAGADGAAPGDAQRVLLAMAFTAPGLAALAASGTPEDPDFRAGAGASAAALRDPTDPATGTPIGWRFGDIEDRTPDLIAIFGSDSAEALDAETGQFLTDFAGLADAVADETGARLPGNIEHFGFVDGISQPALRGRITANRTLVHRAMPPGDPSSEFYARPGRPLVWPGQYLFGYPTEQADSTAAGPIAGAGNPALRNGSLLVLRRLRQDVAAFQDGMARLADVFTAEDVAITPETAAGWCVGRWPDGSPINLSPDAPDPVLGADTYRRNGFLFAQALAAAELSLPDGSTRAFAGAPADASGHACPFFAHIRQVNPRDERVDFGGSGVTRQSQMLRRGVPYGPAWSGAEDGADRGLLFLSYQTSIANQFHRLIKRWVNDNAAPLSQSGIDPLIGADKPQSRALVRRFPDRPAVRTLLDGRWVASTGAAYAYAPGIGALRRIVSGRTS